MRKVNISVHSVQVAAIGIGSGSIIVKRSKSGHYFFNIYRNGRKLFSKYIRWSGWCLANYLGLTLQELNKKLFDSTLKIELKKRSRVFGLPK